MKLLLLLAVALYCMASTDAQPTWWRRAPQCPAYYTYNRWRRQCVPTRRYQQPTTQKPWYQRNTTPWYQPTWPTTTSCGAFEERDWRGNCAQKCWGTEVRDPIWGCRERCGAGEYQTATGCAQWGK